MSNSRFIAWTVWLIVSIFYAYQYVLRVMPNILIEDIMGRFHMGASAFGQFSGVYYIGYALMHLPIGIMLDRFGPRKVMVGSILLSALGLVPLLFTDYLAYPILGRFLMGLGSSGAILGVFKIIRLSFDESKFARMLSLSVMIGLVGAIYGGGPVSYMKGEFGYNTVLATFIVMGLVLSLFAYILIPPSQKGESRPILSDIKQVFGNKRVLMTCFFAGLMVGPLEGFADVWGTVFLKKVFHFDSSLASSLPSLIFIGMCFGSPILSYIAEKTENYLLTIVGAGIIMASGFISLLMGPMDVMVVSIYFVLIGVCSAYQIIAIYKASTYVKEEVAGLTTAAANMIIMVFGYLFHSIIGTLVSAYGGPDAPLALKAGITAIPVALAIGSVGFIYLWRLDVVKVKAE